MCQNLHIGYLCLIQILIIIALQGRVNVHKTLKCQNGDKWLLTGHFTSLCKTGSGNGMAEQAGSGASLADCIWKNAEGMKGQNRPVPVIAPSTVIDNRMSSTPYKAATCQLSLHANLSALTVICNFWLPN
jgi:hypothetical protein